MGKKSLNWWEQPPFSEDLHKMRYRRRSKFHDYTKPNRRYMITILASPLLPVLSRVFENNKGEAEVEISQYGWCFVRALQLWQGIHRIKIMVGSNVVMPDHVHFCVTTISPLEEKEFSRLIAHLKREATRELNKFLTSDSRRHLQVIKTALEKLRKFSPRAWEAVINAKKELIPIEEISFFADGFTDSIALSEKRWTAQQLYIADNPRRLLFKRMNPQYFRQRWKLCIGSHEMVGIGNVLLLQNPVLQVVRYSSKFSKEEQEAVWKGCEEALIGGGVLVSPFINPLENEWRKRAVKEEGNIIRICDNGFSDRYSPSKEEFEQMRKGRLLLLSENPYDAGKQEMSKSKAMGLNELAELVAKLPWLQPGEYSLERL